ncbi:type II toxin-antitoxin system RelE/ParE family toxin, partial [Salmonella enterica]|nr:type II toxin-antitoxin system RelE/ParE family toxin [Salmonella enterica]EAY6976111.1 type II toxin-antitoxin system RelE/ParE family toxin [Salmonella enterica]
MRTVKLTPKASEDLENIWHYGWQHFGEIQADRYINHLSEIFSIMSANNI